MQAYAPRALPIDYRLSTKADELRSDVLYTDLNLGKYFSGGGFSLLFESGTNLIRISLPTRNSSRLEFDLMHWASITGAGAKLLQWGKLNLTFGNYKAMVEGIDNLPSQWPQIGNVEDWKNAIKTNSFTYAIIEKWDGDLSRWLQSNGNDISKIPEAPMKKLLAAVQRLHKVAKIIHLDLFAKNILYKLDRSGQIARLGLTDFGNANFRNVWLFERNHKDPEVEKNIDNFVNYFMAESLVASEIARRLKTNFALLNNFDDKQTIVRWGLNKPENFDLSFFYRYYFETGKLVEYLPLKLPIKIEFTLPWKADGTLEVEVIRYVNPTEKETIGSTTVSAFASLKELRSELSTIITKKYKETKNEGKPWIYLIFSNKTRKKVSSDLELIYGISNIATANSPSKKPHIEIALERVAPK